MVLALLLISVASPAALAQRSSETTVYKMPDGQVVQLKKKTRRDGSVKKEEHIEGVPGRTYNRMTTVYGRDGQPKRSGRDDGDAGFDRERTNCRLNPGSCKTSISIQEYHRNRALKLGRPMTRDEVKAAKKATPKFNSADYDE